MKTKKYILFYGLMFLPLLVSLAALQFLPEQIPAHYDLNNQVTRWGSKYESLILPVITIFFGYFMLGMARHAAKHEENGRSNENICIITGIALLVHFNVMSGYFLYTGFHKVENFSSVSVDPSQLLFGMLGISMIIIGNIMPKLRMNSVIGLRTSWSMKNETTWKKSQRFGGISFMLGGIVIIVICFTAEGMSCFLWTMAVNAVLLTADICYTYKIAKKF